MRKEAERVLENYFTLETLIRMKYLYDHRIEFKKCDGRSGIDFHRGVYSHEILMDIFISNIHRGKVLKRLSKKQPDFHYYYDENDSMFFCVKNPQHHTELTYIEKTPFGDFSISVPMVENVDMIEIAETVYEKNKIVKYKQFRFELNEKINTIDKIIKYKKKKNVLRLSKINLYSYSSEELFYQDDRVNKGILKINETAYNHKSRENEYEFNFHYEDKNLSNEYNVIEKKDPKVIQFKIPEQLEMLPNVYLLSKNDMDLIENVNAGKL